MWRLDIILQELHDIVAELVGSQALLIVSILSQEVYTNYEYKVKPTFKKSASNLIGRVHQYDVDYCN